MLTSFFSKSKPVNYLLVTIFMTFFFVIHHFITAKTVFVFSEIIFQIAMLLVFLFSMLLIDFISRKNDLTKNNTIKVFVFAVFVTMLPITFLKTDVLIANFFILLALRRILSLKTNKDIEKKIFDAALWISVASCFYFWSFLFIIVLFIAIVLLAGNNFKNFFIPFLSMAAVIVLTNTFTLLFLNAFFLPLDWVGTFGFNFTAFNEIKLLLPISIAAAITLWVIVNNFIVMKKKNKKNKATLTLIIISLFVAVGVVLLTPEKNGSELIFCALPFSILSSNYLEIPKDKTFKESMMWLLLLMPIIILFI
jgi:hypothetical protein